MIIRDLLDDTILRLGLCDRVDLMRVSRYLDMIEAQRAKAALCTCDRFEPTADFSPERHLTPAGGADPYVELHVEYDHEGGAG